MGKNSPDEEASADDARDVSDNLEVDLDEVPGNFDIEIVEKSASRRARMIWMFNKVAVLS